MSFVGIGPTDDKCHLIETDLIVAKRQEAHGTRFSRVGDLDCRSCVLCHLGVYRHRHRQWSLSTMGCTAQPCCDEYDTDQWNSDLLPAAAAADDFLLFSHCLRTVCQGNN